MGQQKGNPTPSYQNQAYEALYPNTNARQNRDMGTKPVMIDDTTTINDYIDLTFDTDAVAAMVSASLNTNIYAVSSSIDTTIKANTTQIWSSLQTVTGSTFVPNITNSVNLFSGTINKTSGYYQKIENIVSFTMHAEFANVVGQQAGTYQFDLPIAPNNNWSGSFGLVNGTATLHSNNGLQTGTLYVVNGSKKVYFDGNRGGTSTAPIYTHISAQYTINN